MSSLDSYHLVSVARTTAVLASLDGGPEGTTLGQVARRAGLSEATALRYLASLTTSDLVERDEDSGRYRLGLGLYRLGMRALEQRDIHRVAAEHLHHLRDTFEETVNLAARQRRKVIILEAMESPRSLRKGASAGSADIWHSTSVGKAILSQLPPGEVAEIVREESLQRLTPKTLTTLEALRADLDHASARGYAIDDEESDEGLRCVGAAIRDHRGEARYAISVSGPTSRMTTTRMQEIGEAVRAAAQAVSGQLGWVRDRAGDARPR